MTVKQIKKPADVDKEFGWEVSLATLKEISTHLASDHELGLSLVDLESVILVLSKLGYLGIEEETTKDEEGLPVWKVSRKELPEGVKYIAMDYLGSSNHDWWGYDIIPKINETSLSFLGDKTSNFYVLSERIHDLPPIEPENWRKSLHRVVFVD